MNPLSANRREFLVGNVCALATGPAWAPPVAVFAHRPDGGGVSVVAVNKGDAAVRATIEAPAGMSSATAFRMESDGLLGKDVRLNGTPIKVNGEGTPKPDPVAMSGRKVEVSIAAASAMWISFKA